MLQIINEGINIFRRNLSVKISGLKHYSGSDEEICYQIIDSCYNKNMRVEGVSDGCFNASSGNYRVFYSRDFGWCIASFLNLGYKNEIQNTLKYVLHKYSENNEITVAINNKGKCFNFPNTYSPDSVAYLFRSLRIARAKKLITKYAHFLNYEIQKFNDILDEKGLLIKQNFSGMRDHVKETQTCYDMIMACMLCDEIDRINNMFDNKPVLYNALKKHNLKKKLISKYWNGNYFVDSLSNKYCSGHSNVYPYFLDIITDKKMLKSSIKSIITNNLDKPIPLKYGFSKNTKFLWYDIFAHNWEKNTSWAMLGLAYIDVISKVDKKKAKYYLDQYKTSILKNNSFIELYDGNKPYNSLFFTSDESMLWASMYLNLKKKLK